MRWGAVSNTGELILPRKGKQIYERKQCGGVLVLFREGQADFRDWRVIRAGVLVFFPRRASHPANRWRRMTACPSRKFFTQSFDVIGGCVRPFASRKQRALLGVQEVQSRVPDHRSRLMISPVLTRLFTFT